MNLTDVDKPQDVYSGIATMVKDQVDRDVSSGHEWAKHLQNDVDRKLVKQTVRLLIAKSKCHRMCSGEQLEIVFMGSRR